MPQLIAHCLESKDRTKDVTLDVNVNFESLMLNEIILNGLRNAGFKKPSPIQLKAIPVGRCGFDIIVKSKSGTGKTLVYSIIGLETVDVKKNQTQVLILAPTREIAVQTQGVLTSIGRDFKGLKVESFIGGLPLAEDKEKCKSCHIAVGAPGRVKHLIADGILKPHSIRLLVFDEVDKLMESSFLSDINDIFNSLPDRKQVITTSATYPNELNTFLCKYMLSPTFIEVENDTPLLLGLKQYVKTTKPYTNAVQEIQCKNEEILKLLRDVSFVQCLIFTNYQTRAESISNFLNQKGWSAMYISAAQSQVQRLRTVKDLKDFKCKILLTTDLTARGIDAANVDLVINYDIPNDAMTYLHRMGRAGRYGSSGVCIDLVPNGTTLQKWQNIIGCIGGSSLGIPKLPEFNGTVSDLLKLNVTADNCIFGTVPEQVSDLSASIKNNVLDLKQQKIKQGARTVDFNGSSKINEESAVHNTAIKLKIEEKSCSSNKDASNELGDKASNDADVNMISAIPDPKEQNTNCDQYKINSRDRLSKNLLTQAPETNLYYKNKALLYVTQILSGVKDSKPDLDSLQYYLKNIKDYDKQVIYKIMDDTKSKSVTELLKNIDKFGQCGGTFSSDSERVSNIENIFEAGYRYATKSNSKHWSLYLPDSEFDRLNHLNETKLEDDACEENDASEVNDNCGILSDDMIFPGTDANEASAPEVLQWVPVNNEVASNPNWEHLASYFNQCSDHLWQNGLSFQSVEDFDNWFYGDWHAQVVAIRNYVQQNIYIREMSDYQRTIFNNNQK